MIALYKVPNISIKNQLNSWRRDTNYTIAVSYIIANGVKTMLMSRPLIVVESFFSDIRYHHNEDITIAINESIPCQNQPKILALSSLYYARKNPHVGSY